ncbi:hypothetical protein IMY05_C4916000100 [Salix suchowensis]|nr:hypothetical protein IMY05_C4916000100 [Salix suchowensis]
MGVRLEEMRKNCAEEGNIFLASCKATQKPLRSPNQLIKKAPQHELSIFVVAAVLAAANARPENVFLRYSQPLEFGGTGTLVLWSWSKLFASGIVARKHGDSVLEGGGGAILTLALSPASTEILAPGEGAEVIAQWPCRDSGSRGRGEVIPTLVLSLESMATLAPVART